MAKQRSPDQRLVYLHCSSIFSGAHAQVRKAKKISQLLTEHKASIKILTQEFTLPAIAAVAKELLEEKIFESLPRAKLRYPELFQPSETQEAERAASEAEVIRIEAEAAQDIVLTSDDEGGDEFPDFEQGEQEAKPDGTLEDKAEAGNSIQSNAVRLCQQSTSQAHHALFIPRLHPVYLPFKTQHKILVLVQSLLEECCLEFGNTWVPDLMEARKWKEAESIELTQWTKRFLKYAKSLPPSAIKSVPGKSVAEVLFGTSNLRHSAVHRLPTSAAGMLNMLSAAITFAEALKDSTRAEKVLEIRTQLEASIEEIVQHQNLLERKLTAQFEDIARRRAELDELEKSSIEEMLATDKKQRTEVGSTFECFLIGSQQVSNPCACSHAPSFDRMKVDTKVEGNNECSWIEHELKPSVGMNEAQAYDRSPPSEGKPDEGEISEKYDRPPCHDNSGGGVDEKAEVSELDFPTFRSRGRKKKSKRAATYSWDITAPEEAPVPVDEAPIPVDEAPVPVDEAPVPVDEAPVPVDEAPFTHNMGRGWRPHGAWSFVATGSVTAEPHNAAKEAFDFKSFLQKGSFDPDQLTFDKAIPAEEPCFTARAETSPRYEPHISAPEEEPLREDTFPAEAAISTEDLVKTEKVAPEATLEASQAWPIVEGIDNAEEHTLNQHDNTPQDSDDPRAPTPKPDVVPIHNALTEIPEFLPPPLPPALWAERGSCEFHSAPPSASSSTVTSVLEAAAASEAPTKDDGHTITLKIYIGSKVLRSIVLIRDCTRTAILNEARAYCNKCAQDDQSFRGLLPKKWDLALLSLRMYGYDTDLLTYEVENLSSLVRTVEETGIPRFTLQISEI